MKTTAFLSLLTFLVTPLLLAGADAKDEITAAAKKLGEKPNYAWRATVVVPESAAFKPGPTEGKTEKDGHTYFTMSFGDNTTEAYKKGDRAAVTGQEGDWQSLAGMESAEGPGRFFAAIVKGLKVPAVEAAELATNAKELKKDGDIYVGELTEAGAKALFRFGTPTNPKGSVKFWVKDGDLVKYEHKVTGKVEFNGNEIEIDRATTVELKDVGTTKVQVPEAARKKME